MEDKKWVSYINGNYRVFINLEDGTKIRSTLDPKATKFIPSTIESMDIKITNSCDRGCVFCVPSGAKIDGKNIEDISEGFKVKSYNISKNITELKNVVKKYSRYYEGDLIKIDLDSGKSLTLTPNHKVYTKNRGYVRADELNSKDILIEENNDY